MRTSTTCSSWCATRPTREPRRLSAALRHATVVAAAAFLSLGCTSTDTTTPAASADSTTDGASPDVPVGPSPPAGLAERGFVETRTIVHLHSAFSHDACDDEGLDADGNPNQPCIDRMKNALCKERIAMTFMTDHPSHMDATPMEQLLYADESAGDQVLRDADGRPWASAFACPMGQGGPDGKVWLQVGTEATHTMPIGVRRHAEDRSFYGNDFYTEYSRDDLAATVQKWRELGAFVTIAHSEDDDIDWKTIADHDVPAMEVYNFHANFQTIFDQGDLVEALFQIDPFMGPGPEADLIGLVLMQVFPEPAYTKWKDVLRQRPIAPLGGADAHENVVIPGICGAIGCPELEAEAPNLAAFLNVGGAVPLNDGERVDAYERVFRWVQNHVWVPADAEPVVGPADALEAGRTSVQFEIFGAIEGMELIARSAVDQALVDLGGTARGDGGPWELWFRTPKAPQPLRVSTWTDGGAAELKARLHRTTEIGTELVMEVTDFDRWTVIEAAEPGTYHLELRIVPRHLTPSLPGLESFAQLEYRWAISGVVVVE